MKVLIVIPSTYVYGGAETVVVDLANYMSKQGIENAILSPHVDPKIKSKLNDTEIIKPPLCGPPHSEMRSIHKGLKDNEHRFDVINPHNYPTEMAMFGCKKPVVWQCNEPILGLNNSAQPLTKKLSNQLNLFIDKQVVKRYIDKVVVSDQYNKTRFIKLYGKIPLIIPYGIDVDFFNQDKDINTSTFKILQVGMIQPFKNQLETLWVVNQLKLEIPHLELTFAGWELPTYRKSLDEYIELNHLENIVRFVGDVDKTTLKQLYCSHDLLLHPIQAQGGWLSPFEALCGELSIIVSSDFTASKIIHNNNLGVVSNHSNYVKDIMKIYNSSDSNSIVTARKQWVNKNLTCDNYCEKMIDLFKKVMK